MTLTAPVKIGVVGLGDFGRLHAQTLAALAEADLCALVARRQQSIDDTRAAIGGREVPGYLDLETAIRESPAEAWVVATSTHTHVPVTRKLLEAGKAVLLEKPISDDATEAASLAPLVAADSSNLMIGHILLFNSEFLALRDEAAKRGPIDYILCLRHRGDWHREAFAGESPFHLTMVHDLYCVQALMAGREPARIWSQKHRHADGSIDLATAQLQWEDGTIASFSANFMVPAGNAPQGFDMMEVYGRGWMARLLPNPRPIRLWDDKREQFPMALEIRADLESSTGMLAEQLRCFCAVVRRRRPVPRGATYQDAMQVQTWIDRIVKTAE